MVDRVLPNVPIRQWVLSLPYELRRLAAFDARVLTAVGRVFVEAIFAEQRAQLGMKTTEHGAVTHIQRFGGSLNLNCHYHVLVLDGAYVRDPDGLLLFRPCPPPSHDAIERVARRLHSLALRWLKRHHYLDERKAEERSNESEELSALDGCAQLALRSGLFVALKGEGDGGAKTPDEDDYESLGARREKRFTATVQGFNVHAAVRVAADNDEARERLVRYCTRPTLSLERLSLLPDGRVAYRVKYPRRGTTHLVMTPVEFLARAAALLPPPRFPLVRYHGVLAPHSKLRSAIVPKPRAPVPSCSEHTHPVETPAAPKTSRATEEKDALKKTPTKPSVPAPAARTVSSTSSTTSAASTDATASTSAPVSIASRSIGSALSSPASVVPVVEVHPNAITVSHWNRLLNGELLATSPRVAWATLLKRTYSVDAMVCPKCGGRLRLLAVINDRATARKIIDHLGIAAHPKPAPRARGPDHYE